MDVLFLRMLSYFSLLYIVVLTLAILLVAIFFIVSKYKGTKLISSRVAESWDPVSQNFTLLPPSTPPTSYIPVIFSKKKPIFTK